MDILERTIELISVALEIPQEKLSAETDIANDLDADSLDLVELAMNIEDEFEIELDDEVVPTLRTIGDLVAEIERLDAQK